MSQWPTIPPRLNPEVKLDVITRVRARDRGRKEREKQYSFDKATFRMAIKRTASIVKCGAAFVCREHFVLFTSRSDGDGETRRN